MTPIGFCCTALILAFGCALPDPVSHIEIRPQHFQLRLGEVIHYTVLTVSATTGPVFAKDVEFTTSDPSRLTLVSPSGIFRAAAPGSAVVMVKAHGAERRFAVTIADEKLPPMKVVRDTEVPRITADQVLLVGHANRDGIDHTAVARKGIDEWVAKFKKRGRPVIYLVSATYPNWYTSDREPTYAVLSEGQEHDLAIESGEVVFTGGDFAFCTLRNVQFVLHRKLREGGKDPIRLLFPVDAIWTGGKGRPYPAPMVTLRARLDQAGSSERAYDEVITGFLDHLIHEYPVTNYPGPESTPSPHLGVLLKDATIEVTIGDDFQRTFRSGSGRLIRMEFCRGR